MTTEASKSRSRGALKFGLDAWALTLALALALLIGLGFIPRVPW